MKLLSVSWLRRAIPEKRAKKVIVLGEPVGLALIEQGKVDVLYGAGGLTGDGVEGDQDRFLFCARPWNAELYYPLTAIKPIYTTYACAYGDVGSVYQDDGGNTIVLLKDPLDTPVERCGNKGVRTLFR